MVDVTESSHIERELMLVKLKVTAEMREEIKRLADIFRGTIIDVTTTTYSVQLVGNAQKLDAFISSLDNKIIIETVRSGVVGLMRGEKSLHL